MRLPLILFVGWLVAIILLFVPPRDPPTAPQGVGLARGFPVHYTHPAPLSAWVGQHSGPVIVDGGAPPWPDDGLTDAGDEPLQYDERFSPAAIGPGHGINCQCMDCFPYMGGCPVSQAAVTEQGVGE